jgi:hypothetical protein
MSCPIFFIALCVFQTHQKTLIVPGTSRFLLCQVA